MAGNAQQFVATLVCNITISLSLKSNSYFYQYFSKLIGQNKVPQECRWRMVESCQLIMANTEAMEREKERERVGSILTKGCIIK